MTVELRVLSTHAVIEALNVLGPRFEKDSGILLSIHYDPGKAIRRTLENGGACDAAIVTKPVFDALVEQGMMLPNTVFIVGRCGIGVSVREGAALPDISTPDALKHTLLSAKTVVRSTDGASGEHFEKLLDQFGIAEAMRDKIVMGKSGRVAELVARGEAELAVQQISELLPVEGAAFAGPYPAELQFYSTFCAGVSTTCQHRDAAEAFIAALKTPAAAKLFAAAGLEPVPI